VRTGSRTGSGGVSPDPLEEDCREISSSIIISASISRPSGSSLRNNSRNFTRSLRQRPTENASKINRAYPFPAPTPPGSARRDREQSSNPSGPSPVPNSASCGQAGKSPRIGSRSPSLSFRAGEVHYILYTRISTGSVLICMSNPMDYNRGNRNFGGPSRSFGGPREMTKTVCSDCGKECEVPFKPTEGRPVYCRDCLPKHRKPRF